MNLVHSVLGFEPSGTTETAMDLSTSFGNGGVIRVQTVNRSLRKWQPPEISVEESACRRHHYRLALITATGAVRYRTARYGRRSSSQERENTLHLGGVFDFSLRDIFIFGDRSSSVEALSTPVAVNSICWIFATVSRVEAKPCESWERSKKTEKRLFRASLVRESFVSEKVVLRAYWTEMVALNFQIDRHILEPWVPAGLELDFHNDSAYISLVCATCRDVRIWGLPLPISRGFKNVYLRFYVRQKVGDEYLRGSCLVKSFVSSSLARWTLARTIRTEVAAAKISTNNSGFDASEGTQSIPLADYHWQFKGEDNKLRVKARHRIQNLAPDTKVGFVLNRTHHFVRSGDRTWAYPMQVTSANVWDAGQASFSCHTVDLFGRDFTHALSRRPISVFLAEKNTTSYFAPTELFPQKPKRT